MKRERSVVQETLQLDAFMKAKNQDLSKKKIWFHIDEVEKHIFKRSARLDAALEAAKQLATATKRIEDTIG